MLMLMNNEMYDFLEIMKVILCKIQTDSNLT